ncbi:MAG: hypothetical protein M0T74_01690 [Desulfitobacterium hafniense]|nr:hypothetical protein [Desulfitobacterium hafniense]
MKIGVFTALYQNKPLTEALDIVQGYGLEAVEIGTGNYPGNAHCDPDKLLQDSEDSNYLNWRLSKRDFPRLFSVSRTVCSVNLSVKCGGLK